MRTVDEQDTGCRGFIHQTAGSERLIRANMFSGWFCSCRWGVGFMVWRSGYRSPLSDAVCVRRAVQSTLALSLTRALSLSLSPALSCSVSLALSCSVSLALSCSVSLALSISLARSLLLCLARSLMRPAERATHTLSLSGVRELECVVGGQRTDRTPDAEVPYTKRHQCAHHPAKTRFKTPHSYVY